MLKRTSLSILAAAVMLSASTMTGRAQAIYTNIFNNPLEYTNWAVLFSYTSPAPFASISNSLVNFNFDYTTLGIPIAPHSALFGGASSHRGLKLSACYTNVATKVNGAATTGMSVCPTNFSVTANFVMHADMWINVDCGNNTIPLSGEAFAVPDTNYLVDSTASLANGDSANSTASTVFYGCGYGTKGLIATTPGVTDAIWVGFMTDNGSGSMVRMYGPSALGESSYQDGDYQSSGLTTPGFPGDPLVYNIGNGVNGLGTRNMIGSTGNPPYARNTLSTNLANGQLWCNLLPLTKVPDAQTNIYPQQINNYGMPGFPTFGWHDVSVEKVGNVIIYKIDGYILATGNYASAGTPPGSYLTFVGSRTATSVANALSGNQYTNLNFVVFANLVVSNYNNVVNVSATTPSTQEGVPGAPGVFDISRPSAGVPLTVSYTLTGTATNGVQYQTLPTTVTFASTATDTNISIVPIDDGIPNPTTTVVLTLQSGSGYVGAGSAIVSILDGDTPTLDLAGTSQAYGRYDTTGPGNDDFLSYTITRRGKLTTGSPLTVNLAYGGVAVPGTDFTPTPSVTVPDGAQTATFTVSPLDNPAITTNRTLTITAGSGSGYNIGTGPATGTIVSSHYPAETVLLSDDLQNSMDATNWNVTYGCGDPLDDSADFLTDFGITLSSGAGGYTIPPPPGGNANALFLTCNKNSAPSSPGAVNCYYTNLFLTGNYAVRFNMNIIEGETPTTSAANCSEGPVFGINHTGSLSNWWYGSGFITNQTWSSDGIWYWVDGQAAGTTVGDYAEYTGAGGTNNNQGWQRLAAKTQSAFTSAFKAPIPFTSIDAFGNQTAGLPANGSPAFALDDSTWSDVEIKQINNIVTMSINKTPIFVYTNTTVWTSGYLMLGYADPYGDSIGNPEQGAYYANLQVVQYPVTTISGITLSGGNVVITFSTTGSSDTVASFTLASSTTVNGAYGAVGATITSLGGNVYQATTPYLGGGAVFYRILHN